MIVKQIQFVVIAKTRDECIAKMDEFGNVLLDEAGGQPWVATDDDVKKLAGASVISDDQGFFYQGIRTYQFHGPLVPKIDQPMHDGYHTQKGVGDAGSNQA